MNANELKINISAKIGEFDEELKEKIINFTNALSELPNELFVELKVLLDEKESKGDNLKLNLSNLLIEQVKQHFNKNN